MFSVAINFPQEVPGDIFLDFVHHEVLSGVTLQTRRVDFHLQKSFASRPLVLGGGGGVNIKCKKAKVKYALHWGWGLGGYYLKHKT